MLCLLRLDQIRNLRRNYVIEFHLAKLLISSRNRGVECGSNPSSDSR